MLDVGTIGGSPQSGVPRFGRGHAARHAQSTHHAKRGRAARQRSQDFAWAHPARLRRVLDNFPRLEVTAAHLGAYHDWDAAGKLLPGRVKVDTSSSLPFLDKAHVRALIDRYGLENCFFGTDFPLWRVQQEVEDFFRLGLPYGDMEKLLAKNFQAYYGVTL